MKYKWMFLLLAVVLVVAVAATGCAKEEKKVTIAWGMWSGGWLPLYVSKILLEEELGYTVEIAELSVPAIWTAIAAGDADVFVNSWQPNQEEYAKEYDAEVDFLGVVYGEGLQGWLVPKWVSEQYGITKVPDLDDPELAKLFDIDGDDIGDLLGCDAAWKCAQINDDEIAGYELGDLYEQKYGAEMLMTAAIEGRMKKNEPVLFYFYVPHPFFVRWPVGETAVWLDDPKDFWPVATSEVIAGVDWIAENPKAVELLSHLQIPIVDINWSMAEIEARGDDAATLEQIAREWMAQNQATVDSWRQAIK